MYKYSFEEIFLKMHKMRIVHSVPTLSLLFFQIANPYSQKPSLKFCTVPYSYTQVTLKKNFPGMYNYMKQFNTRNTTSEAIKAVKEG